MSGWAQRDAEEKEERAAWTEARLKQAHELEEENAKLRQALEGEKNACTMAYDKATDAMKAVDRLMEEKANG